MFAVVAVVAAEEEGVGAEVMIVVVPAVVGETLDQIEEEPHLQDHTHMPGTLIPMTTTTEHIHQGYLQMTDILMTGSEDYHPQMIDTLPHPGILMIDIPHPPEVTQIGTQMTDCMTDILQGILMTGHLQITTLATELTTAMMIQ